MSDGLELPKVKRPGAGRRSDSPIVNMEPGDTYFVEVAEGPSMRTLAKKLSAAMSYQKTTYGRNYSLRTREKDGDRIGIRVWRIA
jgi:hypothetical protein